MVGSGRYRVNSPKVIYEVFEGETVIINFDSGAYYSMNETGTQVWELLVRGLPVDRIVETIAAAGDIDKAVSDFVTQLRSEDLVTELLDEASRNSDGFADQNAACPACSGGAWSAPALLKYEDMRDLLLLDPIHDVDETGWPRPARLGTTEP
jgi:hypothetical protein